MKYRITSRLKSSHAQATLELIVSFGFLLIIFAIVAALALSKSTQSSELKSYLDAKRIGESVKDNINMISQQGSGYFKYFSLPERVHGEYDYNVSFGGNILDLSWAEKSWSTQLMTANVKLYSLDKGSSKLNRIFNNEGVIEITGYRPNLKPDCDSLNITSDGTMINVSFAVHNDAHVDDLNVTNTAFTQLCGAAGIVALASTSPIPAFSRTMVSLNYTLACPSMKFNVKSDYDNRIAEGKESDNECNVTVS